MKFSPKPPLLLSQRTQATGGALPMTFGQARAQKLQERYQKKIEQRRVLKRAEYASQAGGDNETHQALVNKGKQTSRQIGRLQAEMEGEDYAD